MGGDSIFLTENPFTDVANGCAIAIGRPDAPPEKKGVWVRYSFEDGKSWSAPKNILKPARGNTSRETERMFICSIPATRYIAPYRITLSWWTGFDESNLSKSGENAVIEFYARSNIPAFDSVKGIYQALRRQAYTPIKDEYKLYLQYKEDEAEGKKYRFEILDCAASIREQVRLRDGESNAEVLPSGHSEVGDILPGYISSRAICGIKTRKLIPMS